MSTKPNITTKKRGDKLTAEELNKIVDYFTKKLEEDNLPVVSDGKSAYQIAVELGFEGTEEEWLNSLSPNRYFDINVFTGEGTSQSDKVTLKDGAIGEEKLSDEVRGKLNSEGYGDYQGTATPSTNPVSPSTPVYYFAGVSGTYTNFGGLTVNASDGINILSYSGGVWSKVVVPINLSGYTEIQDFEELKEEIKTVVITSKNLLDKEKFEAGSYSPGGAYSPSTNWINSGLQPIPQGIDSFTITGERGGNYIGSTPLVLFYNASGQFISSIAKGEGFFPKTILSSAIPAGATQWRFNLTNIADIGVNPTDNEVANTILLRDSSTSADYQPYGGLIDPLRLAGPVPNTAKEQDLILTQQELSVVSESVDALFSSLGGVYLFNGSTSYYDLGVRYLIKEDGDYIELESSWGGSGFTEGLGLLGVREDASVQNIFGYYSSSEMRIREKGSSLPWIVFDGLTGLENLNIIRLEIISGKYNLFINGVLKGQKDVTNGIEIRNIGNGYNSSHFRGKIRYLKMKSGANEINIDHFIGTNAFDIDIDFTTSNTEDDRYSDFFYEFSPTAGTTESGRLIVFTKRKGFTNTYVGHFIERHLNLDEATYIDYWRNRGAWNYIFNGTSMAPTGTQALLNVENEFTMLCPGKADHTGGTHGDELTVDVSFIVDGKKIGLGAVIPLTECRDIKYQVVSTLHETAPSGGDPVAGHPIIADHTKTVTFGNGGWVCRNHLKSRIAGLEISRIYTGLICNHKDQSTHGFTDVDGYVSINEGDNSEKLKNPSGREFFGNNPSTGLNSYISSKCVYPSSLAEPAVFYINDRPTDSKYYRWVGPVTLGLNDTVVVESKLKCL